MCREFKKIQTRYDQWETLRENAIANRKASGASGPLPRALTEAPPPRPPPPEDDDMTDVSIELQNGAGMDSFASDGPGSGGPFQMETAPVDRAEMVVRFSSLRLCSQRPRASLIVIPPPFASRSADGRRDRGERAAAGSR
jgi:hypothetical protein